MKILAFLYKLIVEMRNLLYDRGIFSSKHIPVPVISVGNLTAGGTGKTPFTIFLAKLLMGQGISVAILTRGYGRTVRKPLRISTDTTGLDVSITGDEPALLHRHLKNVPIIIDADRIRGAESALREFSPDVLIMDDGFQHRKIHRDLNILLWDATTPKNHWDYLPCGRLREGFKNLQRASLVVVTRIDAGLGYSLPPQIEQFYPRFFTKTIYSDVLMPFATGEKLPVSGAREKKALVFAGIGNPNPFFDHVKGILNVAGSRRFPDHHRYSERDISSLSKDLEKLGADLAVTTEKDILNLERIPHDFPLYYLGYQLEIDKNREDFIKILRGLFA